MNKRSNDDAGNKASQQLKSVLAVPREERLAKWCSDVTLAMLNSPEHLKGVMFKCNDDAMLAAHKFVLGIQTPCVPSCSPLPCAGL
jgi:hypothetical protein